MTSAWHDSDDALLEALGPALHADPDPERTAMLMSGYDLVMADFVETELLFDSHQEVGAASVRSDDATLLEPRTMAFGCEGREIEFEMIDGRLIGHIDPPAPSKVYLDRVNQVEMTEPDDVGAFEFQLRIASSFRIRVELVDGPTLVTPWIVPNEEPDV